MCAQGQDVLIDNESFKLGSRFANKIWNASRYILGNLEGRHILAVKSSALSELDRWIYHTLNETVKTVRAAFESYRYNDAAQAVYEFFWNNFCDWYVEGTKLSYKNGDEAEKDRITSVLLAVLEEALQEIVRLIRALRAECGIDPQLKLRIVLYTEQDVPASAAAEKADLIKMLAGLADIRFINDLRDKPAHAVGTVGSGFEAFLVTGEEVDCSLLIARFSKELEKEKAAAARLTAKLANANFTAHAPAEVVNSEKEKLQQAERRSEKFTLYLQELGRQ